MQKYLAIFFSLSLFFVAKAQGQQPGYVNKQLPMVHMSGLLRLVETIPLPTDGSIDHLTVDLKGQRLFIAGESARSLVVVDLNASKVIHLTTGLGGNPRTPFYLPDTNEIWVDLGDNTVVSISGTTYEVTKTVELTGGRGAPKRDPDNAAYDPATHLYYAAVRVPGTTDGSIEIVDTKAAKLVGSIEMDGTEPAGLIIDPSGKRLYVGMGDVVGGDSHVKVIDLEKRAVVAEWPITGGQQPHAAGLDAAHHRLFMGSRKGGGHTADPGAFVVLNTDTGKTVQTLDAVGGADGVQYDAATGRIYFMGTTGTVAVFKQMDPDHYQLLGKVPTGPMSKTGLWVPELKRLYSAVPKLISYQTPFNPSVTKESIITEAHLMVFDYLP
jgi:DNA-binding beta-propeller fold protein YncE